MFLPFDEFIALFSKYIKKIFSRFNFYSVQKIHYSFHLQHNSYWCGTCYWRSANLLACTSAYWQQIHHCNSICYPHHLGNNFLLCLGRSSRNNTYSILRCVLHFARKTQSTHCRRNVTNNYTCQQCCTQMLIFDNIVLQY